MDERGHRSYGRGYAWALVGVFTALSVVLNAAHAVLGMMAQPVVERVLAVIVAIVAPVSLLLATELVVRLIRDWRRRRRWVTWLRGICTVVTVGIGVIAFAMSAVALTRMAALMGVTPGLAWGLTAVVDAMIVIATLAVVVAEAEMALDRAEGVADQPVTQPADMGDQVGDRPVGDPADRPLTHPAPVGDRPLPDVAVDGGGSPTGPVEDHPIVHPIPTPGGGVVEVASSQLTGMGTADHPPTPTHGDGVGITHPSVVVDGGGSSTTDVDDRPVPHPSAVVDHPVGEVVDHPVTHPVDVDDRPPATVGDLAAVVAESTRTTKPVEVVAAVLDRAATGESQRAIAEAVGVDRTVVRKWIRTADELGDGQTAHPHLASV